MSRLQRGFSLLELLVALFVVVLVTSLATLNVGSGNASLRLESALRTLADTNRLALDEAQLSGRDYGLLWRRDLEEGETVFRYSWRERREEGWRSPASGAEVFSERSLPVDIEVLLELEGQDSEEMSVDDPSTATPQVIFYASGEVTPGALELRSVERGELLWRLEWDLLGRTELMPRGEPGEVRNVR